MVPDTLCVEWWNILSDEWWVTEIKWGAMNGKKKISKQGLNIIE